MLLLLIILQHKCKHEIALWESVDVRDRKVLEDLLVQFIIG